MIGRFILASKLSSVFRPQVGQKSSVDRLYCSWKWSFFFLLLLGVIASRNNTKEEVLAEVVARTFLRQEVVARRTPPRSSGGAALCRRPRSSSGSSLGSRCHQDALGRQTCFCGQASPARPHARRPSHSFPSWLSVSLSEGRFSLARRRRRIDTCYQQFLPAAGRGRRTGPRESA